MSAAPFDKLPNEVLLYVFVKGDEDEIHSNGYSARPRRLKTFAATARRVCIRWKTIIDYHPSNISFWIAYLVLTAKERGNRSGPPVAKQLATFRSQLLSSDGCDLCITFDLRDLDKEMANDTLSPYATAIIQLVIHAMDMITPYHSQVIRLGLTDLNESAIFIHLLKLVAARWRNASRLAVMTWQEGRNVNAPLRLNLSDLRGYGKIRPATPGESSSQMSLACLCNLDTFRAPARLRLDTGFILPPALQHTRLFIPQGGLPKLFDLLWSQNNSLGRLRSITIERHETAITSPSSQDNQGQANRPTSRIRMPFLHEIFLDGIIVQEVYDLLRFFLCPSLEVISLDSIKPNLRVPELREYPLSLDFPRESPRLTSLKALNMKHLDSMEPLYCLGIFMGIPVEKLSISIRKYQPDWISHRDVCLAALSNLHIQDLTLDGTYWVNHCILTSVGTQNLTVLDVDIDWKSEPNEPLAPVDQELLFPRLRELRFHGSGDHLLHFLSQLKAGLMDTFDATVGGNDELEGEWNREQALQALSTKCFASVRYARLSFSDVTQCLPHLNLFPDLHKLAISTGVHTSITEHDATEYLVDDVIQPLCDALIPTISGTVPLRHLGSIYAFCDSNVYGAKQPTKWSDDAKEEVRLMVHEMLEERATALAEDWALQLTEPFHFDYECNSKFEYEVASVEFWVSL